MKGQEKGDLLIQLTA